MSYQIHQLFLASNRISLLEFNEYFIPEEHLHILSEKEKLRYGQFTNDKRRREFVATRLLFHLELGYQEIQYTEHGAPFINAHDFISISHAQNLVGFARNSDYAVGFDIELIHPKVLDLYSKFLNTEEQAIFDCSSMEELIACWSLKEVLYKMAGRKEILFKEDLLLSRNTDLLIEGKIMNPEQEIVVTLQTSRFNEFILSTNSSAPIYVDRKYL